VATIASPKSAFKNANQFAQLASSLNHSPKSAGSRQASIIVVGFVAGAGSGFAFGLRAVLVVGIGFLVVGGCGVLALLPPWHWRRFACFGPRANHFERLRSSELMRTNWSPLIG
jgi:hypothetical protein